jgi:adenylyltransferase/sulfurtransferase
VRTDGEYAAGHIPVARHIPLADLPRRICGPGAESADRHLLPVRQPVGAAADAFAASGWDAHSIGGGLIAWAEAGFELDPDGGSVIDNPNMPPR